MFKVYVELKLITDPEIFLFFESAMRGGISVISSRYARANNPYLEPKDYDSSQPHSYIYYLDANNLYGLAMSKYLPVGGLRFLSEEEISKLILRPFRTIPKQDSSWNAISNIPANCTRPTTIILWRRDT
jgi:hypothetical protein